MNGVNNFPQNRVSPTCHPCGGGFLTKLSIYNNKKFWYNTNIN